MRKCKKVLSVIVLLCMLVQFLGCKPNTNAQDFDQFINKVHLELYSSEDPYIDFLFNDKTSAGFSDVEARYTFTSKKIYNEKMSNYEKVLSELNKFNYYQLSDEQKLNYDILKDFLKRELLLKNDYKYVCATSPYFAEDFKFNQAYVFGLSFESKKDFDLYLKIIQEAIDSFDDFYDISKFQMENNIITKEDAESLTDCIGDNLLNVGIEEKVNDTSLYTEDEKIQYLDKYNILISDYRRLADLTTEKLQKLYDTYKDKLGNDKKQNVSLLAQTKEGKTYYKHLLQQLLGTQIISVEQLVPELKMKATKVKMQLDKLCRQSGMKPSYQTYDDNVKFCNFSNNKQIMDYLENNYSKYFPEIPKLDYTLKENKLSDGAQGAFYVPPIDRPLDNLTIAISLKYSELNYTVLAHEGFPGHMYQITYNSISDIPTFRKINKYGAYSEGWATYVQKYILNYLPIEDKTSAEIRTLSFLYERYVRCLLDIYVNYYGWTYEQFADYYMKAVPKEDDEIFSKRIWYQNILEMPVQITFSYSMYSGYFEEMYDYAKLTLGDKFNPVEFHKVILDCSYAGIDIVRKQVNKYVIEKKLGK